MQITDVKVFPVEEDKLKAYASIVFDHCFIVNDLKVIRGKKGLFISMPSRRRRRGGYRDVAHPLNNETRRSIEETVLAEYERALEPAAEEVQEPEAAAAPEPVPDTGEAVASPAPPAAPAPSPPAAQPQPPSPPAASPPPAAAGLAPADSAAPTEEEPLAAEADDTQGGQQSGAEPAEAEQQGEKTLEEVEELHLRDSFWTVS